MDVGITDTRDLIIEKLREMERNISWLNKKTDIPYATLYDCLVRKGFKLSWKNLEKINKILDTEYE